MNSKKTKTKPKMKDLKAKKNPKGGGAAAPPSEIKTRKIVESIIPIG